MTLVSFRIGEAFSVEEPVARFMAVVAMISNDWQRLAAQMLKLDEREREAHDDETTALLITNYRLQAALHYEAARCLHQARNWPEIREFIVALPKAAIAEYRTVVGGVDPESPHYHGKWLANARNRTFHYSKLNRGEPIGKALKSAADKEGSISYGTVDSVRFGFADVVALEWLGGPDADTDRTRVATLRVAVLAMTQFAQRAMRSHLDSKGIHLAEE